MPPARPTPPPADPDLAQAFQEVAKGEKTAEVMETQLTILERKIDELLASVDLPSELDPIPPEEDIDTGEEIDTSTSSGSEKGKGLEA